MDRWMTAGISGLILLISLVEILFIIADPTHAMAVAITIMIGYVWSFYYGSLHHDLFR